MGLPANLLSQVRRRKAELSLYEFAKQSWPVIEPATPFIDGYHLRVICDHLQAASNGEIRKLLINMPPRFMKSILVSVAWPCWEWVHKPHIKWLFAAYAGTLSIRDSVKCRRLISSAWYQSNWADRYRLLDDQNQKVKFENDHFGYRLATSVDGTATGEGGDRIVVDDPHNVREAHSETIRESTKEWWRETMSTRVNNPRTSAKVIVMQRVHEDDLSAYVLDDPKEQAGGGWNHLCLPLRYDPDRIKKYTGIGWTDPRQKPGELLWPERYNEEDSKELETTLGSYAAAGQLQQIPSPKGGGMIKSEWFKHFSTLPRFIDRWVISCDTSFKGLKTSKTGDPDYAVITVWLQSGDDFYLVHLARGQWESYEFKAQLEIVMKAYPLATVKLIEDKANGPAVISEMQRTQIGIEAVDPQGGKIARAAAILPYIEAGRIYLPVQAEWLEAFIKECERFPNGKNDDQVDAMTQLINWALENGTFTPMGYSH